MSGTFFHLLLSGRARGSMWLLGPAVAFLGTMFTLMHLYAGLYGMPDSRLFATIHLCIALAILYLIHPAGRRWDEPVNRYFAIDLACFAGCAWLFAYALYKLDAVDMLYVRLDPVDYATVFILMGLVLEAIRRTVGMSLVVISAFFFLHALTGNWFPGVFNTPPSFLQTLLQNIFIGATGIYGVPLLTMVQYIVLFLFFGKLLQLTGVGSFFARIAFAGFGHRVGGPAKASVASSALFGTVSGSGVSNVLTTGPFTIPMMKRMGYPGPFAGGVESASSVGGAIMPPVMGAVAFMMAEFMGVPYRDVVIAAIIPAALYFLVIYWTVHFEARKNGLRSLDRDQLPSFLGVLKREGYLAIPLLMIVAMLLLGYSIILVALVTSAAAFLLSFVDRATRMTPSRVADALESTARTSCVLSATCACAGIIIAAISTSGLSFQVTQSVMSIAGQQLWLLLLLSGLIAIILGTGLTASAVYITMVATVIPILKSAGVVDMSAHMFAFYFGVVADITPPTALAAVAAAGLARANPMSTMISASRIGIAAFIVPITFVYSPALLMQGTPLEIATAVLFSATGLYAVAVGLTGYRNAVLGSGARFLTVAGGILMIVPEVATTAAGVLMVCAGLGRDVLAGSATGTAAVRREGERTVRLPAFVERWLEARVAREREDLATEMEGTTGGAAAADDLARYLEGQAVENRPSPPDATRWIAWLVLAAATLAIGWMGSEALHARDPRLWVLMTAIISAGLTAGLLFTLRGVDFSQPAETGATSRQAIEDPA